MILYAVNYNYKINKDSEISNDTWYIGATSSKDIYGIMELNAMEFKNNGFELLNYSFRKVETTDNGYSVMLTKNRCEFNV